MTFEEIRLAVEFHMAGWNGPPVAYDGTRNSPAVNQAIATKSDWVTLTINHGASITAGIGSDPCVRRTGLIQFQIFTDDNTGSRPAALLADSLAQHWEYWQDGGIETQAASVRRIGESDGWYMYLVSLSFRAG
jgi:hypothetical protein